MSKKINYTEGEIGNFKIVKDFLSNPSELVMKERNVRVTINLRESSVNFFKGVARSHHSRYQRVIRSLIDTYATQYSKQR